MALRRELQLAARGDLHDLPRVAAAAHEFLATHGVDETARYLADLALEEAVSNVMRHGGVDREALCIDVRLSLADDRIVLQLVDRGRAFDPLATPEPNLDAPLEERRAGGLGIVLLRRLTADLRYERAGGENRLQLTIPRADGPSGSGR